jgi:pimeloyl-ACP methyl ester carboxylesterase
MLYRVTYGNDGSLPPLLIVHGLFGSARNWGAIQRRLAEDRRVMAIDQRNHGQSPWAPTQTYADMAGDLAEVIESEGVPFDVVGHSMGGKAAMMLALTRPDLVNRLVVADIAPVAYGHSNRHLVRAMEGLDLTGLSQRGEADRRLEPLVPDPGTRAFLLQSLDLKDNPPRWRLNLPVLDAEMDKIVGWPEGVVGSYDGPTLFLSGALSDYVRPDRKSVGPS